MKQWFKKNWINLVLILVFFVGIGLIAYPSVANYWNSFHQSRAIAYYAEAVADVDDEARQEILGAAKEYNERLVDNASRWVPVAEDTNTYKKLVNINDTGIMGYIEIPKIKCALPIYHGTDEAVLQIAIGHIEGSSLPVGGESTHCVLSGHRGLPSARLFTDLDKMDTGDTFLIRVLDEVYTYEVDQILIVDPDDLSALEIVKGEDLCTLVTCTPYGINTHRLLIRGHRIENEAMALSVRVTSDALQIEPIEVAPIIGIPVLLLLIILELNRSRRERERRRVKERLQKSGDYPLSDSTKK